MTDVLTAAQMRAIEQTAIKNGSVTGLELMERAGQGVVEAILEEWPDLTGRAVVLCGPGNNGGDGFVVARLLKQLGWAVEVFFHGEADKLPQDAKANYDRWAALGPCKALIGREVRRTAAPDIYVDAIFGIGLSRPVSGDLGHVLRWLAGYGGDRAFLEPKLVAVDVPSGLDADTGSIPGAGEQEWAPACPFCALTVTFHRAKVGHVQGRGLEHCGKVVVKDIGL